MTVDTNTGTSERGSVLAFFANPWVGIAGSIASVVGLILAVYFYVASTSSPDVVYYINPARAVVVKQGTASRLGVQFDNRSLTEDVTAAQIAIWNNGDQTVRPAAVLSPVAIRTDPRVAILEASVRKTSRDVVQLQLDQSRLTQGEVLISWNVLEGGDGGVLQIVYAGGPDTRFVGTGVFEGQRQIRELRYPGTIRSASEQIRSERRMRLAMGINLLGGGLMLVTGIWRIRRRRERDWGRTAMDILPPIAILVFTVYYGAGWLTFPDPPFGFE